MPTDNELKIAVCDDMEKDCAEIAEMTAQILRDIKIPHSISGYADGRSLLDDIGSGKIYNILLLDVMMDEMDGMELAAELRRQGNHTTIIFISINREMALRGYEVSAVRYLAKPLREDKLKEALLYCHECWQAKKEILLPTNQGQRRTSFSDIQFVEAIDRGTRFVLAGETVDTKLKFREVEALLPKTAFIHCHRSYIVNIAFTKRIRQYEFDMKSGAIVPISRPRYNEVNRQFVRYLTA